MKRVSYLLVAYSEDAGFHLQPLDSRVLKKISIYMPEYQLAHLGVL